jgi:hypothetical protein
MKIMKAVSTIVFVIAAAGCDALFAPDTESRAFTPSIQALSGTSVFEGVFHTDAIITCNVIVSAPSVLCTSPQDPDVTVPGTRGGLGMHARLARRAVQYDSTTGLLRVNMQVKNLLYQAMGSTDGDTTGVKAFFYQNPTVTLGSGTVTVANYDGIAEFTALNQRYFEYPTKIYSMRTTAQKQWTFNVPTTVQRFRFRIYISAGLLPIVAFDMEDATGNRDIYRVNLDGSELRRVTNTPGVDMWPTVAKDRVVFVSYRDGDADLFEVSLAGGPQTKLTNTGWNETEPALSSDGTRLAYVSDQSGWPRVVHAGGDGANPQTLAYGYNGNIPSSPTWMSSVSPRLAFASSANGPVDILQTNIGTGVTTRVLTTLTRPNIEPKFNADGSKMTFVLPVPAAPTNTEIWLHDVATNANAKLTARALPDAQPTFTHDGRIIWLSGASDGSYVMRWMTPDAVTQRNVGGTGAGQPWNPFGVPLH